MNVLINRADRPDRLREARKQLTRYNIKHEVFPAIIDKPGWKGCRDSHLAVLEKYRKEPKLTIYEDDVLFLYDIGLMLPWVNRELPNDWAMLYLGVSPREPLQKYSDHLYKVGKSTTTHAIMWNTASPAIDYILEHKLEINKWDGFLSDVIHKQFNCFVIYPLACTQWDDKSDTCYRTGVDTIIQNYKKYCV